MLEKVGCKSGQVRVPWKQEPAEQNAAGPQSESMAQAAGVTLPRQAIIPAAAAMRIARKHHADNKGSAPAQDL
jgi:hypothetical protein